MGIPMRKKCSRCPEGEGAPLREKSSINLSVKAGQELAGLGASQTTDITIVTGSTL